MIAEVWPEEQFQASKTRAKRAEGGEKKMAIEETQT